VLLGKSVEIVVIIVFTKSSKTYNIVAGKHARASVENCVTREREYM